MAQTPRPPSSYLSQTSSAPAGPLEYRGPSAKLSPRPVTANAKLDTLANVGLGLTPAYKKLGMPPQYHPMPLTGAAALADMQRQRELEQAQKTYMTSPNPAALSRASLLGQPPGMSSLADAPPRMSSKSPQPQPPRILGSNVPTPVPSSRMGPPMTESPAMMSSPSRMPQSASTTPMPPTRENSRKRQATSPRTQETEGRSNKAMTFPPPPAGLEAEASGRNRGLSYPMPDASGPSRSPSGAKKHKCPHCNTEFTRHHNLKSHLLTHSQEKPYACQECSSKFRRLHDLKRHLKLHTGERPHVCERCGRKFARGDALARHNKGPGGCAGRRGSQGGDDDEDEEGPEDTTMAEGGEEDAEEGARRQSEPNREPTASSPTTYRHTYSTYPPPALSRMSSSTTTTQTRPMYPPQMPSSSTISSREPSYALSPTSTTGQNPFNSMVYASPSGPSGQQNPPQPGSLYATPGIMTESPKPLSPGQVDPLQRGTSDSSLSAKLHQTQLQPRLPPPGPHASTLPSLPSLTDPRYPGTTTSRPVPPAGVYTAQASAMPTVFQAGPPPPGPASAVSTSASHSLSSNGPQPSSAGSLRDMYPVAAQHEARSSAGSVREIPSSSGLQQQDSAAVQHIRNMERRGQEAEADNIRLRSEVEYYKTTVLQLQDTVTQLRQQLLDLQQGRH